MVAEVAVDMIDTTSAAFHQEPPHMLVRPAILLAVLGGLLLGFVGCDVKRQRIVSSQYQGPYPIKATVTVGMIADMVKAIGGQRVEVTQLIASGVDPHTFKPLREDVLAIRAADIVFYNGLLLEGRMAEVLARIADTRPSIAVAERLPAQVLDATGAREKHLDPHVWMDVSLWLQVAGEISEELQAYDPKHAAEYREAYLELAGQLRALHAYGQRVIGCIPEEQRVLVTSHDAFQYFSKAYGIEVEAVQGISTDSEAGLSRINQLVDMLVQRRVASVFVESSVAEDSIRALLRGAESRGHRVVIAASLFSDAMGPPGSYEGTYIGMMDHNFTTIAKALGCREVPGNGFRQTATP
jgi:manganese/zinc/iron transport system substrate-binding protein